MGYSLLLATLLAALPVPPAADAVTGIRYMTGTWPKGKSLDVTADLLSGTITLIRFPNGDCATCENPQGITSRRQLAPEEIQQLRDKTEAVWAKGSSIPKCFPGGHTQMSLIIHKGGTEKRDDYMTPACITQEAKALTALLSSLSGPS